MSCVLIYTRIWCLLKENYFNSIGEEEQFSLYPFEFLAEITVIKDRLSRENKQKFNNVFTSCVHMGHTKGKREK